MLKCKKWVFGKVDKSYLSHFENTLMETKNDQKNTKSCMQNPLKVTVLTQKAQTKPVSLPWLAYTDKAKTVF